MNKILYIALALICVALVSAASPDYLAVPKDGSAINPKETVKSGEPIAADITLKRVSEILPEESKLNITINMVNPWVRVTIDGAEKTFANEKAIEVALPKEGVKEIRIHATGNAPTVEKLTKLNIIEIKTYVRYTGTEGEYQKEIALTLDVTNPEIKEVITAIKTAKDKLSTAENMINVLKTRGVNTVELESQLQDAKTQISLSEELHDDGKIELAKSTAKVATNSLNRIIADAGKIETKKETRTTVKDYAAIAAVVIAVILIALFIKKRREELG